MHEQAKTRIAVVIPVYGAQYLPACLASVFNQTRPADEVIVVDDGSPEGSLIDDAVARYGERVVRLRQPNLGAGAARNHGVRSTNADLIAFLDADDLWAPELLCEQERRLMSPPGHTLVYANATLIGTSPLPGRVFMDRAPSCGEVTVEALIRQRCTVLTSSVLVRRSALMECGLFDEEIWRGQDFDMWVRLAHRGARFAYTSDALVVRRIHGATLSGDRMTELERARAVLMKLSAKLDLTADEQHALRSRVGLLESWAEAEQGKRSLKAGDLAAARARFARAASEHAEWSTQAVAWAMRFAPTLTRRAYLLKTRRHQPAGGTLVAPGG